MSTERRDGAAPGATARASAPRGRPSASGAAPRRGGAWGGRAGLLVAAFVALGAAPALVAASLLGLWHPPTLGGGRAVPLGNLFSPPVTPTATPAAAPVPRAGWIAAGAAVSAAAGGGATIAHLGAGFPVTVTGRTQVDGRAWDAIRWPGPTAAAGGSGWVAEAAVTASGQSGATIGDVAALARPVADALARLGPQAGLAVYFPGPHQLYLTNGDGGCALGEGARALLLTALAARGDLGGTGADADARAIGQGDAAAAAAAYARIGGAPGLTSFVQRVGLSGIDAGVTWDQTQATPGALAQLYAALAGDGPGVGLGGLDAATRARVLAALAPGGPSAAELAPGPPARAHGTLVAGAAQEAGGWSVVVAGTIAPPAGPRYVAAACAPAQSSRAAGLQGLTGLFAQIESVAEG